MYQQHFTSCGNQKTLLMHYTNCNITKGGNVGRIIVSGNVSALYVCVHHIDIWYAHMYFALRLQQEFKIEFVHFFTYVIDCILCYVILCSSLIFIYNMKYDEYLKVIVELILQLYDLFKLS